MYKVFFNNRTIILTDNVLKYYRKKNGVFYRYHNKSGLELVIDRFEKTENLQDELFIFYDDLSELKFMFKSCFSNIGAAGGLVKNKSGKILMIRKRGKWDLPKGKMKKGENYREAGLREVSEECGIHDMKIRSPLKPTYHTYWMNNERWLKKTYWYNMYYSGNETLVPFLDEEITEARWFTPLQVGTLLENTYGAIKQVLKEGKIIFGEY